MLPFWRNRQWLSNWVLAGLTETAVTLPWLILLFSSNSTPGWAEALPGPWLPLVIYLAAGLWEAGAPASSEGHNPKTRVISLAGGIIAAYAVTYMVLPGPVRHGFFQPSLALAVVPVAAYLWYRGIADAAEGITHGRYTTRYIGELVAAAIAISLILVSGAAISERVQVLLYWSVMLLFATGLTVQMLVRDQVTQRRQSKLGEGASNTQSPAHTRLLVAVLVLLVLSLSPAVTVGGVEGLLTAIWRVIFPLVRWGGIILSLIFYRWAFMLAWPFDKLSKWFVANFYKPPEPKGPSEDVELGRDPNELPPPLISSEALTAIVQGLLIAAVVVLVAWMLYRLTQRISAGEGEDEEERVSLGFWASLTADLKSLLNRARAGTGGLGEGAGEELDPTDPRSLFRRLQAYGFGLGRPRQTGETPNAYRTALVEREATSDPAASLVTRLYNQARYGRKAPAPEAVREAATALSQLTLRPADGASPQEPPRPTTPSGPTAPSSPTAPDSSLQN